ncbi:proline-rich nuclear receptor coactivator 1 [Pelobates fuscus]|uniref:proline-rich nuclear receptor coactivator 1 n=1 Tax=Pelobates fuscus TaxID=191477 RepID=UPI002FE4D2A4
MSEPGEGGGGRKAGAGLSRARGGRRRGRKNKVRATPFPTRHHQHHQTRAGEPNRDSAPPGLGTGDPGRTTHYRQLRREVLKTKVVKSDKKLKQSDKSTSSHSPSTQRCEQRSLHKPKGKCYIQHTKSNYQRKTEKFQPESDIANHSFRSSNKKPLASAENVRNLKAKTDFFPTGRIDKEINYAGAKFSDPPSPSVLPKPPSHWMGMKGQESDQCKELMTYQLKTLLKVQL